MRTQTFFAFALLDEKNQMALVEPLVGHLLSKYQQTVQEGLDKIHLHLQEDGAGFANAYASQGHAVSALILSSQRGPNILEQSFMLVKQMIAMTTQSNRLVIARTITSKETYPIISSALSNVSEANLNACLQALGLLAAIAIHCPQVVLSRFGGQVPLHLACFKAQLPFGLRRIRNARLVLLANLASSKYSRTTTEVISTHGFLTQLLEDTAEILRQDEGDCMKVVSEVLDVIQHRFIGESSSVDKETKKQLLVSQRNILRILIKALSVEPIAERCSSMLYQLVDAVAESSSDYALSRTETDDKGMPNFLAFTILRSLHPKNTAREAALVCYILNKCPDLIRPYFVRVSSHLSEDSGVRGASSNNPVNNVAVLNVLTRSMLAPLPFHLQASVARLQPSSASAQRFFSLTPKNAAEEVCPPWLAEFIHKRINNSTNLAVLVWTLQVTQAAVNRGMHVYKLIQSIHASQQKQQELQQQQQSMRHRTDGCSGGSFQQGGGSEAAEFLAVDMEQYDAEYLAALESFLPKREEFWHRMTQQLHKVFTSPVAPGSDGAAAALLREKTLFVMERLNLLMDSYTTLFRLRVSWLSAAPTLHPRVVEGKKTGWAGVMDQLLQSQASTDVLSSWTPKSVATLCNLLCSSLARGVQIPKLHHVNTGNAPSTLPKSQTISDWPLLLSLVSWYCLHRGASGADDVSDDTQEALGYITRLVLLCVHSVSVRYAAELDEVYLWLSELDLKLIPMLLHVLNIMMARSMSKTAEKIAASLTNTEHGVLVECATLLIQKTREKKSNTPDAPKVSSGNVWQINLEENIDAFEVFVGKMKQLWPKRQKMLRRGLSRAAHAIASFARRGRKQLTIAVLAPVRHGQSTTLVEVLQDVCGVAASPPGERSPDEEASVLSSSLIPLRTDQDDAIIASIEASQHLGELLHLLSGKTKKAAASGSWMASAIAPWCALRKLAAFVDESNSTNLSKDEQPDEHVLPKGIVALLRGIIAFFSLQLSTDGQPTTRQHSLSATLTSLDGVMACILLLLQFTLRLAYRCAAAQGCHPTKWVDDLVLNELGALALRTYGGTLSAADRLRYAVLLHLHYLQHPQEPTVNGQEHVRKTNAAVHAEDGGSSDENSTDSADDTEETEGSVSTTPRQRPVGAEHRHQPAHVVRLKRSSAAAPRSLGKKGQGLVLSSCVVPAIIKHARFTTEHAAIASNTTREVDVLTQLLDSWTEQDARRLTGPLTLSNNVYVRTSASSTPAETNLASVWRAVFPDVLSVRDRLVVDMRLNTQATDMDPRFLLPLVHTVAAISAGHPDLVPPHLLSRMFSFSVRALSSVCPSLRLLASNILALTSKFLTPQRRTLLNYARLRTLKGDMQMAKRGVSTSSGSTIHRLPASVSAFIVAAQSPLHRYDHHLHNDVVNFLSSVPASFSAPFPLDHLLTAFPLGCLTHSLMVQKQDELVRGPRQNPAGPSTSTIRKHAATNSILDEGGNALQAALEKEAPVHLHFILSMLSHSSGTSADARALVRSGVIGSVLSLITMLSSHPMLRQEALQVITRVCSHSADVASTLAVEGQVLSWTHSFALHLTEEFAARTDDLCGALFEGVLLLTKRLVLSLPRRGGAHHRSTQDKISHEGVLALSRRLRQLNVSSKSVWEAVEGLESILSGKN